MKAVSRPAPIRTDASNAFAHHTMKVRVPGIIREVQALNPDYPAPVQKALDTLRETIQNDGLIAMIDLPAPDYDQWARVYEAHDKETWLSTEWFFAEHFFYRHLIQAVRWWETGRDPFAPKKAIETSGDALWQTLATALSIRDDESLPVETRLRTLIHHTLWGNRIDLSYELAASHGGAWVSDDLLVDDSEQAIARLLGGRGTVHFVNDNAGTELAMDLALADTLLDGIADRVIFHLKMHPTFVSDAIVPDVLAFLDKLEAGSPEARRLAGRLRAAFVEGRLRLAPDLFWNSSRFLWDSPARLRKLFQGSPLVIVKGDANYRRMVGDALWQPEIPLSTVAAYFPAPILAVRTLKSDPVVGLPDGMAAYLYTVDKDWRINGRRGVIQFAQAGPVYSPGDEPRSARRW
jgi:Damage-control phosphatase ARMT1-like domain